MLRAPTVPDEAPSLSWYPLKLWAQDFPPLSCFCQILSDRKRKVMDTHNPWHFLTANMSPMRGRLSFQNITVLCQIFKDYFIKYQEALPQSFLHYTLTCLWLISWHIHGFNHMLFGSFHVSSVPSHAILKVFVFTLKGLLCVSVKKKRNKNHGITKLEKWTTESNWNWASLGWRSSLLCSEWEYKLENRIPQVTFLICTCM